MRVIERPERWNVFGCVSEGDEAIFLIEACLVGATDRPPSRVVESAANALAAGESNGHVAKAFLGSEDYATFARIRVWAFRLKPM